MTERPILFNAPMVLAILAGRKTQTRRAVKLDAAGRIRQGRAAWHPDDDTAFLRCPYGRIGDHLWVRETWQHDNYPFGPLDEDCHIFYRADYAGDPHGMDGEKSDEGKYRTWQPSSHMPRWASRIKLEITGVRIERLNDITAADAIAEGLKAITKDGELFKYGLPDVDGLPGTDDLGWPWSDWNADPVAAYKRLWEQINGAGSWDENPLVWAISFRAMQLNLDIHPAGDRA